MSKESEAEGIVATLRNIHGYGRKDSKLLESLFRASGMKGEDIITFLSPEPIDNEDASFAESKLLKLLAADDDFRAAMDSMLFQTPYKKLRKKMEENIPRRVKPIFTLELLQDGGYWWILLNSEKLIRIRKKEGNSYWGHIFNIARDKKSELDGKDKAKGVLSWFNSSTSNPIYKEGRYKTTKLLRYQSDFVYAEDGITIKELSARRLKEFRKLVR